MEKEGQSRLSKRVERRPKVETIIVAIEEPKEIAEQNPVEEEADRWLGEMRDTYKSQDAPSTAFVDEVLSTADLDKDLLAGFLTNKDFKADTLRQKLIDYYEDYYG